MEWMYLRRIFGLVGFFFVLSLFWYTDQYTLWTGGESRLAALLLDGESSGIWLPVLFSQLPDGVFGNDLWQLRLFLGVFPALIVVIQCYGYGQKLLGLSRTWGWMIILVSIPVWVQIAKTASFDIWLAVFQLTAVFSALQYLKSPGWSHQLLSLVALLIAGWLAPISTLVFSLILWVLLWRLHPQGKGMIRLGWLPVQGVLLVALLAMPPAQPLPFWLGWEGSFPLGWQLLLLLIGVLPWLPFLPGVLADLYRNGRRKEEFSVLFGGLWLAALLSGGVIALIVLGLLLARQVSAFHLQGYPWKNLVKTFALLHLVVAFIAITVGMMGGYYQFGAVGFRAAMAAGSVYWIASFVSVIGLYGQRPGYLWGGMAAAGAWLLFIGNVQVGPLVEQERSFVKKTLSTLSAVASEKNVSLGTDESRLQTQLDWYVQPYAYPGLDSLKVGEGTSWWLSVARENLDPEQPIEEITGRFEIGRPDTLWLGRPIINVEKVDD
jgi:hypothetical protein